MAKKGLDFNIRKLMGLRYKSHPWHGIELGDDAPDSFTCFIEMVDSDTVKYEVDKASGFLRIDRPQKFSSILPALYGFIPQTYCDVEVAQRCKDATGIVDIVGDGDPLDICVLTEKRIPHGDLLARVKPIGGFRMIDNGEADDKIIGVLIHDAVYGDYSDISQLSPAVLDRLRHYFLTYKDLPCNDSGCEIPEIYDAAEAKRVILAAMKDYEEKFTTFSSIFG